MANPKILHRALREKGYDSRESNIAGKREVFHKASGKIVGKMTAHEAWSFLDAKSAGEVE
jgi:hypothetical protein